MKTNLFFRSIDSTQCHPLDYFLHDAKIEGIKEITLIKAEPDNDNPDYIFCSHHGEIGERDLCKKSECSSYNSKSGRGVCAERGKLYYHGEQVTFKIEEP